MKRATLQRLSVAPGLWVNLSPSEREDIRASYAKQTATIRDLKARLKAETQLTNHHIKSLHAAEARIAEMLKEKTNAR